jgi:hypothetical protein
MFLKNSKKALAPERAFLLTHKGVCRIDESAGHINLHKPGFIK